MGIAMEYSHPLTTIERAIHLIDNLQKKEQRGFTIEVWGCGCRPLNIFKTYLFIDAIFLAFKTIDMIQLYNLFSWNYKSIKGRIYSILTKDREA